MKPRTAVAFGTLTLATGFYLGVRLASSPNTNGNNGHRKSDSSPSLSRKSSSSSSSRRSGDERDVENNVHPERFDELAKRYDREIERSEKSLGMKEIRAHLLAKASGDVLEIAVGTWRNNEVYDKGKVTSLTLIDRSAEMLEEAKRKISPFQDVRYLVCDAHDLSVLSASGRKFDTVVDTFGLCSFASPETVLNEVLTVLKDDGKLLLLEHGRRPGRDVSSIVPRPQQHEDSLFGRIVNWWIDYRAPRHAAHWGCLWNRPILEYLLTENPAFAIESVAMHHLMTTYEIVCTKRATRGESNDGGSRTK